MQVVKANKRKGTDSLQASAEETAKYEVKSADYMVMCYYTCSDIY
ncbi:hypothetical protein ABMB44_13635 [Levilactobacillus brevis]